LHKQPGRGCFEDTYLHAWFPILVCTCQSYAVGIYINRVVSNTARCGTHTPMLERRLCRRRDSEELVEHVLRIVLGFDL